MPTVNEMIQRLEFMRNVYDAGEKKVAIAVPGEGGFTSIDINVAAPPAILVGTLEEVILITCFPG